MAGVRQGAINLFMERREEEAVENAGIFVSAARACCELPSGAGCSPEKSLSGREV